MLSALRPSAARLFKSNHALRSTSTQLPSDDIESGAGSSDPYSFLENIRTPTESFSVQTAPPPPPPSSRVEILEIPPAEDPLLRYLASALVRHGRRAQANRIAARTLLHIHALTRAPPLPILREALSMAAPAVRCMMHRHGTKIVAKPVALGEKQRMKYSVRWILEASYSKMGKTLEERLAREMVAVIQGGSNALKKKEEVHKFAMVNRCVCYSCHLLSLSTIVDEHPMTQGECIIARIDNLHLFVYTLLHFQLHPLH
jgi:small subunit ribosomal protein S7